MFSLLKTIILSQEQLEKRNRIYFKQKEEKKRKVVGASRTRTCQLKKLVCQFYANPPKIGHASRQIAGSSHVTYRKEISAPSALSVVRSKLRGQRGRKQSDPRP